MGTKFTKGPWNVNLMIFEDEVIDFHITDEKNGSLNAICCADEKHGTKRTDEELHANAYLIAAAPDLLEALKLCAGVCAGEGLNKSSLIHALENARAAIKKALGE